MSAVFYGSHVVESNARFLDDNTGFGLEDEVVFFYGKCSLVTVNMGHKDLHALCPLSCNHTRALSLDFLVSTLPHKTSENQPGHSPIPMVYACFILT